MIQIKNFFIWKNCDFLKLQTSLSKYISSMIYRENKQQKFLFYGIQFFKSNYLHEKESNSFSPEDTTHRTTACIACGASNKAECIIFLSVPEFFKEIWLSYPILPEFYQNSLFCRTEKRIEFHKPRFL